MTARSSSAQFSADGQRVVTASEDKTARVWDAATGKAIGEPMKHEGTVNSAQFSAGWPTGGDRLRDKTARSGMRQPAKQSASRCGMTTRFIPRSSVRMANGW